MNLDKFKEQIESLQSLVFITLSSRTDTGLVAQQALLAEAFDKLNVAWEQLKVAELKQQYQHQELSAAHQALKAEALQLKANFELQVQEKTAQWQRTLEFEAMLKRIIDQVRNTLDEEQILQTVVQELAVLLQLECCDVALYEAEQKKVNICYEYTTTMPSAIGRVFPMQDKPELYAALVQGQCLQFCKLVVDPIRPLDRSVTVFACPLVDNESVLGDLWLFRPRHEVFSEVEIRLVQQVAAQCAIALRQARLYQTALAQITERQMAQEALRSSEQQYRQLAESIDHVTWLMTPDAKVLLYISPNYKEIWGRSCASLYEHPLSLMDAIHPEDQEKAVAAVELDPTQMDVEYRIIRPDGTQRWIHTRTHPVLNEVGQTYRVVGIASDITLRKLAEAEILKALQRERELSEAKSQFIAMTSHDLRTPLMTIQSSVDLLKRYGEQLSPSRQQTHLDRISSAVGQMTGMVQDVLLLSEAEANKLQFHPAPCDFVQLCRSLVAELLLTDNKQHQITFTHSSDGTAVLSSSASPQGQAGEETASIDYSLDEKLVRYILTNLLSNALKYSPPGSTVQLNLTCQQESVIFRIQDQGIGIPPEHIPHLFESFYRAANVGVTTGTGLGLAIVKQCVDLHGGEITVDSIVGEGTTFAVTLPLSNNGTDSPN